MQLNASEDKYLDLARYERKNTTRELLEEHDKTKELILSNDTTIEPFEMYANLVYFESVRKEMEEKNIMAHISDDLFDLQVTHLIDAHNINKSKCGKDWFRIFKIMTNGLYQGNIALLRYVNHKRRKLSELCETLYKE